MGATGPYIGQVGNVTGGIVVVMGLYLHSHDRVEVRDLMELQDASRNNQPFAIASKHVADRPLGATQIHLLESAENNTTNLMKFLEEHNLARDTGQRVPAKYGEVIVAEMLRPLLEVRQQITSEQKDKIRPRPRKRRAGK